MDKELLQINVKCGFNYLKKERKMLKSLVVCGLFFKWKTEKKWITFFYFGRKRIITNPKQTVPCYKHQYGGNAHNADF